MNSATLYILTSMCTLFAWIPGTAFAQFPDFIQTPQLNGVSSIEFTGVPGVELSGTYVQPVGDVNADSFDDFVICSPQQSVGGIFKCGQVFVIFGGTNLGELKSVTLNNWNGQNGFVISGLQELALLGTASARAGDLNGDGIDDLVLGAPESGYGTVYVIFGNPGLGSSGTFNLATLNGSNGFRIHGLKSVDNFGSTLTVPGDLNGDGFPDLAIGAPEAGDPPVVYSAPDPPTDLAADDVDGDGDTDVVALSSSALTKLTIYRGTGSNLFSVENKQATLAEPDFMRFADIDGDGDRDLIVDSHTFNAPTNSLLGQIVIFKNNGSGTFTQFSVITLGDSAPGMQGDQHVHFDVDDIDGDNDVDIVLVHHTAVSGSTYTHRLERLINNGSGVFSMLPTMPVGSYPNGIMLGDMDNDGDRDVVIAMTGESKLNTYKNQGNATFNFFSSLSGVTNELHFLKGADLNGDGWKDVLGTTLSGSGYYFRNNGDGSLMLAASSVGGLGVQDLNQDGAIDLVGGGNVTFPVRLNDGAGNFSSAISVQSPIPPYRLAFGDFDKNGTVDVAIVNKFLSTTPASFTTLLNNGNATFPGQRSGKGYVIFGGPAISATGGNLSLSALNGTNGFKIPYYVSNAGLGRGISPAGDVNIDGLPDLLLSAPARTLQFAAEGAVHVLYGSPLMGAGGTLNPSKLNGSNGFIISGGAHSMQAGISVAGGADINMDGHPDIAIGALMLPIPSTQPPTALYLLFTQTGIGSDGKYVLASPSNQHQVMLFTNVYDDSFARLSALGDINGDGSADVLIGSRSAKFATQPKGAVYGIFGHRDLGARGPINVNSIKSPAGFIVAGQNNNDQLGMGVAFLGDMNQDGIGDFMIGAPRSDPPGTIDAGRTWLVFGMPLSVESWGRGTTGCSGPETLTCNMAPRTGSLNFAFIAKKGPIESTGILFITDAAWPEAVDAFGIGVNVLLNFDAATQIDNLYLPVDGSGVATASWPIPLDSQLIGQTLYAQGFFDWQLPCNPTNSYKSSTNGLAFTFLGPVQFP